MFSFGKTKIFKIGRKKVRKVNQKDYLINKSPAYELAIKRLEYFNQFYGFTYRRVTIKNTVSRWGSCSKQGNLNFNYRIATLPSDISDYIIVHELCHLGEFNHSKNFWNLVEKTIPNYQELRNQLKKIRIL